MGTATTEWILRLLDTRRDARDRDHRDGLYLSMFFDDARGALVGLNDALVVSAPEANHRRRAENLLGAFGRDRLRLAHLTVKFLESVFMRLTTHGAATFVLDRSDESIQLRAPRAGDTVVLLGQHYERVPRGPLEQSLSAYEPIPSARVWQVELPSAVGDQRRHLRMLRELAALDRVSFGPSAAVDDMVAGRGLGFDFDQLRSHVDAGVLAATRRWGWDARGLSSGKGTDFYRCYRSFEFRRTVRVVLGHCVEALNRLLDELEIDVRVVVLSGMEAEPAAALVERVKAGKQSLVAAIGER